MVAFAASDWTASNVLVVGNHGRARRWGAETGRMAYVQLTLQTGLVTALTYPSAGMPLPGATLVGFRESIYFAIPGGPWISATLGGQAHPWLAVPPPTGTPTEPPRMRIMSATYTTVSEVLVTHALRELPTGIIDLIWPTTANMITYMMVFGK